MWTYHCETLSFTGVVTSPNYPGNYPSNLDKTETIEVENGKILRMEFTMFDVGWGSGCQNYFVRITDGDGTILMDNSCGYLDPSDSALSINVYFLPPIITTTTNRVEIFFHTDGSNGRSGWSLSWSEVTPGEKALMLNSSRFFHPFDLNLNFDIFIAT